MRLRWCWGRRGVRAKLMWTALAEDFGVVIVIVVGLFDYDYDNDNDNDNESSPFGISVSTPVWIVPAAVVARHTPTRLYEILSSQPRDRGGRPEPA